MQPDDPGLADEPAEQANTFQYDYRLRCPSGHVTPMSAAVFEVQWSSEHGAIACGVCGKSVPARNENLAARADDDPALVRERVSELIWYHTSTYADWPSSGYAASIAEAFQSSEGMMPPDIHANAVLRAQTKALHVGTYESAIENMHRRMWTENDAESQFYLHRVVLSLAADDIDPNMRHESHEEASQITIDDLGANQAARYINVEESPGSISMAIDPSVIAAIQTIAIPTPLIVGPPSEAISRAADALDSELFSFRQELETLPQSEGFAQDVVLRRRGDAKAIRRHELQTRITAAREKFETRLSEAYLAGINPIVRERLTRAVAWPRGVTASEFHEVFRTHAALITGGAELIAELRRQPPRTPSAGAA